MDQSLDDIIKKKRGNMPRRGRGRGAQRSQSAIRNTVNRGGGGRGMVTKRGRGANNTRVADARFKIIAKKRENLVDARDQLAQLAKQTDARDKLNNLRVNQRGGGVQLKSRQADARSWRGGRQPADARWPPTGRGSRGAQHSSRGALHSSRGALHSSRGALHSSRGALRLSRGALQSSRPGFAVKKSEINMDVDLMYDDDDDDDDYMEQIVEYSKSIPQRTVQNSYRGATMPQVPRTLPVLRVKVPSSEYSECYYDEQHMEPLMSLHTRAVPPTRVQPATNYPRMRQDWADLQKTSIVVRNNISQQPSAEGLMSQQLRSRLDVRATPPPPIVGFKVVVSNLQSSVTEEDIKELFGDIGALHQWRLLRPGVAEVIYKQRSHAVNAVEVYHKRQLDGQPMSVVLVNGQVTAKGATANKPVAGKMSVQPDLGIIHKALFKL